MSWTRIANWIIALVGVAAGYGALKADVEHLKGDMTEVKGQVGLLYQNAAFGQRGEQGPRLPLPEREETPLTKEP